MRTSLSLATLTPSTARSTGTVSQSKSTRTSVRRTCSHAKPRKLFPSIPQIQEETVASSDASSKDVTASEHHFRLPLWSTDEFRTLHSFLLLYSDGSSWTSCASKTDSFWEKAGQYVQLNSEYCHTGQLCSLWYT